VSAIADLEEAGQLPTTVKRAIERRPEQREASARTDQPDQLGRYALVEEIGRGGMGVVSEAEDPELGRAVAVKCLLGQGDRDQVARFITEARITAQLDHPNIVPVHDLGLSEDGRLFFVMKRIRGRALSEVIAELRRGEPQALADWPQHRLLNAFLKICQAIGYAHEQGVIHRDLKPSNIMVGAFGEVLVVDWGVARLVGDTSERVTAVRLEALSVHKTADGVSIGTPGYMAPEQSTGKPYELTSRSDVWSLGAILYELLAYRRAYPPTDVLSLLYRVVKGPPEAPSERVPEFGIDPELEAICLRAMATEPGDRFSDAEQLGVAVEDWLAGSGRRTVARRRRRLGAALVLVIALVIVALVSGLLRQRTALHDARDEAEEANRSAGGTLVLAEAWRHAEGGRATEALALARTAVEAGAPGATDALQLLSGPQAFGQRLTRGAEGLLPFARFTEEGRLVLVTPDGPALADPESGAIWHLSEVTDVAAIAIDRGGHRVLVAGTDGRIGLWSTPDGVFLGRITSKLDPIRSLDVADGRLSVRGGAEEIWHLDSRELLRTRPWQGEAEAERRTAASPVGPLRATASRRTIELSAPDRPTRTLSAHRTTVVGLDFSPDGRTLASVDRQGAVVLWSVDAIPSGDEDPLRSTGARNNLRVCPGSTRAVPVVPFPDPTSVWASPSSCAD